MKALNAGLVLQSSPNGSAADVFAKMKASAATFGQDYVAASAWHHILLYLWSVAVGASVAACGVFSLRLNGHVQPGIQPAASGVW